MAYTIGDRVEVRLQDAKYFGWIVCYFNKRNGQERVIIEDENGRVFIQRPDQLICL